MAQLRDKKTSECIASGTPTEMVLLAEAIGVDEVVFDDVGEGFDPTAVKASYEESKAALSEAVEADEVTQQYYDSHVQAEQTAQDILPDAEAALTEARARLEG